MTAKRELNVVFGAGPLGLAVADQLIERGHHVRVVRRAGGTGLPPGAETMAGDASEPGFACEACSGAAVVYHCANPRYTRWPQDFPPLQRGILAGATAAGAKLIFGDNLYMYGPAGQPLREDLPNRAPGPNGRTRAEMAAMLLEAHAKGQVRVAIARASDFYGPRVLQSALGERAFGAAVRNRPAQVLGNPDVPHTYTYIVDFARALVTLGERDEALGRIWHVPSAETITTRQLLYLVYREAGAAPRIRAASRPLVTVMALFSPMMRALKEQLYQFERPFVMDSGAFERAFGVQATPHDDAIRETVRWYRELYGAPPAGTATP